MTESLGVLSKGAVCLQGSVEERMQQVQARKQKMVNGALTDQEMKSARIEDLKMLFR